MSFKGILLLLIGFLPITQAFGGTWIKNTTITDVGNIGSNLDLTY